MGIQINGNGDVISAADGSLTIQGADFTNLESLNVIGVTTFQSNVNIAGTLTYEDVTNVESIGVATFRDDVNIGVGGTTAFFDVSTGRIGVGTASPGRYLDVQYSDSTAYAGTSQLTDTVRIFNTNSTTGSYSALELAATNANGAVNQWTLANISSGTNFQGDLAFHRRTSTAGWSEALRIDADGKLLIGVTSSVTSANGTFPPSVGLLQMLGNTANAAGAGILALGRNETTADVGSAESLGAIVFTDNQAGNYAAICAAADGANGTDDYPGALYFSTTADAESLPTERMRLDSSGNLGIGTDNPAVNLHVNDAATGRIRIQGGGTSSAQLQLLGGGRTNPWVITGDSADRFIVFDDANARLTIDSSGRVLVGIDTARTSESTRLLQIEDNDSKAGISLTRNAASVSSATFAFVKTRGTAVGDNDAVAENDQLGTISFYGANGTDTDSRGASIVAIVDGQVGVSSMPGRLVFSTTESGNSSPTERLRIDSNGMVELRANQGSAQTNIIRFTDTDTSVAGDQVLGQLQWFSSDVSGGGACVKAEIAAVCDDTTPDVRLEIKTHSGSGTDPIESVRITSAGNIQLRRSGTGIDFAASQGAPAAGTSDSEVLDSYEQGTWTPTASTNMGTVTNANGNYVKVGNIVTVNYFFSTTSVSTVDNSQIEGLPFNVEQNITGSSVVATGVAFEDNRVYMHFAVGGTDNIAIETDRPIQGSTSGGSQNIRGSVTYMTAF